VVRYERDDVRYRHPDDSPWLMEVYRPQARAWEPYQGDIAKVLMEADVVTKTLKYSESEARDDHGRWTSGGSDTFISSPSDAVEALVEGDTATISKTDVRAVLNKMVDREDHPDITNLHVDGMRIFDEGGLGISRVDMPQIPSKHRDKFVDSMREQGIKMKDQEVSALSLKPAQNEISGTTTAQMLRRFDTHESRKDMAPIFVSKDNFVLDGHHRWAMMAALTTEHPKLKMPVTRIMLDHSRALELMLNYAEAHGYAAKPHGKANRPWLKDFNESQHPRDDHGRFSDGGGESAGTNDDGSAVTPHQKETLWLYTGDHGDDLNSALRSGTGMEDLWHSEVQALDALVKANTIADTKLFRGMNPAHLDGMRVGTIIEDKAFISTSRDQQIANHFGDTVVQLAIPKGTHGVDVQKLKMQSPDPPAGMNNPRGPGGLKGAEQEVILPRGSRFQIVAVDPNHNKVHAVLLK
jgi:hypothetical protein